MAQKGAPFRGVGRDTLWILLLSAPLGVCAEKGILGTVKTGEVLIQRDRWGVPHIYGQSMTAVAFGAGYAQVEDHLDGMLRLYLKAQQ